MSKFTILFSVILWLNLSINTTAQEQENESPNNLITGQLDLGESADAPRLGDRYVAKTFEDWDLVCVRTEAEKDPCSLVQILEDQAGTPVAEVSIFRIEEQGLAVAAGTVIVPLETLLTAKLTISVEGATGKRYNYSYCNQIGCVVQVGFTKEDIEAFETGLDGVIEIVPALAPEKLISINMSLRGFAAGYDEVDIVKTN